MKNTKRIWIALAVVVIAAALIAARVLTSRDTTLYFTEKVDHGEIRDVVEATGTINAVITVQVGSQVSGTIDQLNADFNSHVKKNQVIARIDPSLFDGALLQAKADLETARANVAAARANLEKAKAAEVQARADYERTKPLTAQGVLSPQQLDVSKANEDSAVAAISAADAGLLQAQAQATQKAAAVTVAQTNLDHTIIRAPIDGVVVSRNVDIGQTVAASLQAPTLFTIAQDLTKMQVYTKTDESDVGQIKADLPVTFKVDAFPNDQFRGHVSQIRMNATTVQNVVTYDTIINFDNPELRLFPGMTAYVTIPVAIAHDVLKVPNAALRYKPDLKPEEMKALFEKAGIAMAAGASGTGMKRTGPPGGGQRPQGEMGGGQQKETRTTNDVAVVWKMLAENKMEPVQIRTGITDHTTTQLLQVLKGDLKEGDVLLTGSNKGAANRMGSSPLGGPPRGR